jgi:hypothetical protein
MDVVAYVFMKRKQLLLTVLMLFAGFTAASAETVRMRVNSTDPTKQTLTATPVRSSTGAPLEMDINSDTEYLGFAALDDLKQGQEIDVELRRNEFSGDWEAAAIRSDGGPQTQSTQPAL